MSELIEKIQSWFEKRPWRSYLPVLVFGLLAALLLRFHGTATPGVTYEVGDIAREDIYAPRDLEIIDEESTEKRRKEAAEAVKAVYDFNDREYQRAIERIKVGFVSVRKAKAEGSDSSKDFSAVRKSFDDTLGVSVSDAEFRMLQVNRFSYGIEKTLRRLVVETTRNLNIVFSKELLTPELNKGIIRRSIDGSEVTKEENVSDFSQIFDLEETRIQMKQNAGQLLGKSYRYSRPHIVSLAQKLVRPSLTFNQAETEERRQVAAESDHNLVPIIVRKGAIIVRAGSVIEPRHKTIFGGISEEKKTLNKWMVILGVLFLTLLILEVIWEYTKNFRKVHFSHKDLALTGVSILLILFLARFFLYISTGISKIDSSVPNDAIYYLLPLCTSAMLVRIVIGAEAALLVTMVIAFFGGLLLDNSIYFGVYFFIGSVFGSHRVADVKNRAGLLKAGAWTGLINIAAMVLLITVAYFGEHLTQISPADWLWYAVFAFTGGLLSAFLLMVLVTVAESLFNYTTDFKLLELANQNAPVLRELMVQAPGTYHHSIIVGTLSESAATAIGENGLLARVACLYHDIGKTKKPLYYIENQTYRENRHDKLTPRMSARVIQAHVKDGIEMARAAKLPKEIIDIIPQHHGTRLISFFYNKAMEKVDPEVETLDEKDFRYEGPRPQTRVAGIILLADGLEAITRTLDDPTPARIKGVVKDHINKIFSEGQLDETDLTLRDLTAIATAFTRVLTSIFHHRIDYPTASGKEGGTRLRKVHDNSDPKSQSKDSPRPAEGESSRSGDSPRLKIT